MDRVYRGYKYSKYTVKETHTNLSKHSKHSHTNLKNKTVLSKNKTCNFNLKLSGNWKGNKSHYQKDNKITSIIEKCY